MNKVNILGIDTSNYTTSMSIIKMDMEKYEEEIIDLRKKLDVKKGSIGLRQSEAHFQHCKNIPLLYEKLKGTKIDAVAISNVPRKIENSYMPVFLAGESYGKVIAQSLQVPIYYFSHQEGHIGASLKLADLVNTEECVFLHLSGGTTEILEVRNHMKEIKKIGATLDISYGQLLDRVGNKMGYDFPAGIHMDKLACKFSENKLKNNIKKININDLNINLSGIETETIRKFKNDPQEIIAFFLMERIGQSLVEIINNINNRSNIKKYIIGGGVGKSLFLQKYILNWYKDKEIDLSFAQFPDDNAIGIGRLGGIEYGKYASKN